MGYAFFFASFLAKQNHTSISRLFSPMRNSVQDDIVTITSQDFILLAGVPFVADHLALRKQKTRWKTQSNV